MMRSADCGCGLPTTDAVRRLRMRSADCGCGPPTADGITAVRSASAPLLLDGVVWQPWAGAVGRGRRRRCRSFQRHDTRELVVKRAALCATLAHALQQQTRDAGEQSYPEKGLTAQRSHVADFSSRSPVAALGASGRRPAQHGSTAVRQYGSTTVRQYRCRAQADGTARARPGSAMHCCTNMAEREPCWKRARGRLAASRPHERVSAMPPQWGCKGAAPQLKGGQSSRSPPMSSPPGRA